MNEIPSIPESISHKRLNKLLSHAKKEFKGVLDESQKDIEFNKEQESFEELLSNWSSVSKELIQSLRKNENYLNQSKGSKSLLALGAMEAHVNMALQALKASETDE